jgi:hypothetical protein
MDRRENACGFFVTGFRLSGGGPPFPTVNPLSFAQDGEVKSEERA